MSSKNRKFASPEITVVYLLQNCIPDMTFLGHSKGTISGVLEHLKMSNGNSRFISLKPSSIPVSGRNLPVLNFAYHLPNCEPTAFSLA